MSAIEMAGVTQVYDSPDDSGGTITVVDGVDLTIEEGSINMLMGPSGCGKSTLLRMMGGVRPYNVVTPTKGTVKLFGEPCNGAHDDTVMVFQHYANLPHLSVRKNVALPFRLGLWKSRIDPAEQERRIDWALDRVGLADRAHNRPSQLSGGQNQRVAIARALVLQPKILLMDEPFGALDAQTRREMQDLLIDLIAEIGSTVVFITHDVDEALIMGDRIIVLSSPPAQLALDLLLPDPRPRDKLWMRSTRIEKMELDIMEVLRG